MGATLIFKILGLVIAAIGACLDQFTTRRPQSLKVICIIVGLGMAIGAESVSSVNSANEYDSTSRRLNLAIEKSDSISNVSSQALVQLRKSIDLLNSVQSQSIAIRDSLQAGLTLQRATNDRSSRILGQTEVTIADLENIAKEQAGGTDTPRLSVRVLKIYPKNRLIITLENVGEFTLKNVKATYFDSILYKRRDSLYSRGGMWGIMPYEEGIVPTEIGQISKHTKASFDIELPRPTAYHVHPEKPRGELKAMKLYMTISWGINQYIYVELRLYADEEWNWDYIEVRHVKSIPTFYHPWTGD